MFDLSNKQSKTELEELIVLEYAKFDDVKYHTLVDVDIKLLLNDIMTSVQFTVADSLVDESGKQIKQHLTYSCLITKELKLKEVNPVSTSTWENLFLLRLQSIIDTIISDNYVASKI